MNKKEYEKPEIKVLEMEDLMDGDNDGYIPARPSIHRGGEGGAKENKFEDEEDDEDTTSSLWDVNK